MTNSSDKFSKQVRDAIMKAIPEKVIISLEEEGLLEEECEDLLGERCTKGDRLKCREEERRRIILDFANKDYFNNKFYRSKDCPWKIKPSGTR